MKAVINHGGHRTNNLIVENSQIRVLPSTYLNGVMPFSG
jgi:hypothetical protein